jgi:hypothetical protein
MFLEEISTGSSTGVQQIYTPTGGSIRQSIQGGTEQKDGGKVVALSYRLGHPSSPVLGHQSSGVLDLQTITSSYPPPATYLTALDRVTPLTFLCELPACRW